METIKKKETVYVTYQESHFNCDEKIKFTNEEKQTIENYVKLMYKAGITDFGYYIKIHKSLNDAIRHAQAWRGGHTSYLNAFSFEV